MEVSSWEIHLFLWAIFQFAMLKNQRVGKIYLYRYIPHDYKTFLIIFLYWLVVYLPILKNMKVSWDDDIPNIWKNEPNVPNHQPVYSLCMCIFIMYQIYI